MYVAVKMEARMGSVLCFLLVAVVFQCVQVQIASAVTCTVVSGNPCKCTLASGGEIDLSPLFGEQLSVQGTGKDVPYTFTYDACKTVPCGGSPDKCSTDGGCLACQDGGGVNVWGIASVNSVMWGEVTTPGYTFTISYENAAQNKKLQVSYTLDSGSGSPHLTFTSESPDNTYNLAVSGCFNTPLYICRNSSGTIPCKVDSGNPCACLLADGSGTIDLSPIFQGPLVTKAYDSVFLYDACKPIPCGSQCINCSGCQVEGGQGNAYGLGTLSSTVISATYMPDGNWALTVQYSNPAQGKQFSVYYTLESAGSAPVFQYVTEITPSNFVFSLHGCFTTPKSSCKTPKLPLQHHIREQV